MLERFLRVFRVNTHTLWATECHIRRESLSDCRKLRVAVAMPGFSHSQTNVYTLCDSELFPYSTPNAAQAGSLFILLFEVNPFHATIAATWSIQHQVFAN